MPEPLDPEACQTMVQVRAGVDAVDAELVALLARRFGYMRAAARIKTERGAVRDEVRKTEVLDQAAAAAGAAGAPAEVIRTLWDQLVEASIAYELDEWERLRG